MTDGCPQCEAARAGRLRDNTSREHSEDTCEDCGRPNISWSIDSDRWNHVVRDQVGHDLMLCPSCFVKRHEQVTRLVASWTLAPATPFRWPDPDVQELLNLGRERRHIVEADEAAYLRHCDADQ